MGPSHPHAWGGLAVLMAGTFATCLITAGRLGDQLGHRRRVFSLCLAPAPARMTGFVAHQLRQ